MDAEYTPLLHRFGAVDTQFLAQSVEVLDPPPPITFPESASIREVLTCLQERKIGCVLIVNEEEKLSGIFSERDVVSRVILKPLDLDTTPIAKLMTANPRTESFATTVAFALQEMSDGGFRHMPIVDDENYPIGVISVKDILDFIKSEIIKQVVLGELNSN